jgi:hypothetical protein
VLREAKVLLTGHSLGGGLAGYLAGVYRKQAVIFDNMPFEKAAQSVYESGLTTSNKFDPQQALRFYGSSAPIAVNFEHVKAYAKPGEALAALRNIGGQNTQVTPIEHASTLNPISLHASQALSVLLLYARERVSWDWLNVGNVVVRALTDDDLGKAVDAARFKGTNSDARIMESAIAYSALTEGERPFGDQAIKALFDDAAELGRIVATAGVSGLVTLSATQAALAKVIVQFAGDVALGDRKLDAALADGALSLDNAMLRINLDPARWAATAANTSDGPGLNVVGLKELVNLVINTYGPVTVADREFQRSVASPAFAGAVQSITNAVIGLVDNGRAADATGTAAALGGAPGGDTALTSSMVVERFDFGGQASALFANTGGWGAQARGDLNMMFRIVGQEGQQVSAFEAVWGMLISRLDAIYSFAKMIQWKLPDDPLLLDLDGDGIETTSLAQSRAYFDVDGDGFAERTGWVGADDGILAVDRDGSGAIENVNELFGGPGESGFAELRLLDSNADGRIDAADLEFASLRVWRDLDEDGVSDAGELFTLQQLGIASIGAVGQVAANDNSISIDPFAVKAA